MPAAIFCSKCGSDHVDVNHWAAENVAAIRCFTCGNQGTLTGFTLGRFGYTTSHVACTAEASHDKAICEYDFSAKRRRDDERNA